MNRVLVAIAALEALVIVFLLVDRGGDAPIPPGARPAGSTTPIAAPPTAPEGKPPAPGAEVIPEAGPVDVFLYGHIKGTDGKPPTGPSWVTILRGSGKSIPVKSDANGWYGRGGLEPGTYELRIHARGLGKAAASVTIPEGVDTFRRDFTIERAIEAAVFFLTTDGKPLLDALRGMGHREKGPIGWVNDGLSVVVTRSAPGRLPATFLSGYTDFGTSQYRPGTWGEPEPTDGRDGTLTLRGRLPIFVSACVRSEVLETIELREPVEKLEFRISPDAILDLLSGVTFRLRCDGNSLDLKAFQIRFDDRQTWSQAPLEIEGDKVTIRHRPPGGRILSIEDPLGRFEPYERSIVLPAGEMLDLGTIHLGRLVRLEGTVLSAEGKPVPGAQIRTYDLDRPWREQMGTARHASSGPDGQFKLGLGPHRYGLSATTEAAPIAVTEVDLRNGDVDPIVIRLADGARVRAEPAGVRAPYFIFIETAAGQVVAGTRYDAPWPLIVYLASGSYDLVVIDADEVERRTPFAVGSEPLELK